MRPLHVVLVHRDQWHRWKRIDGQFAYAVPEFTWEHCPVEKAFRLDVSQFTNADVIWLDDGKYGTVEIEPRKGKRVSPLVYYALYPTLAGHIREKRRTIAHEAGADLVLVDHDRLENWTDIPARRLAYSVNELYYADLGLHRDIDVGFYCIWGHNPGRPAFERWLEDLCRRKGYRFYGLNGGWVGETYARLLAQTKVVVHLNRTPETRPTRIFDCAAAGAALLSNPMPRVSGEWFWPWMHYAPFYQPNDQYQENAPQRGEYTERECEEVVHGLEWLLDEGAWEYVAQQARAYVLACHTWRVRAVQLRALLLDQFPDLRAVAG